MNGSRQGWGEAFIPSVLPVSGTNAFLSLAEKPEYLPVIGQDTEKNSQILREIKRRSDRAFRVITSKGTAFPDISAQPVAEEGWLLLL